MPSRYDGRRREALLRLVERRGSLSLEVMRGSSRTAHAADIGDLLEELNAAGRVSWLGLRHTGAATLICYGSARTA